jgi:2,3-dihydroxybenzoate decarboxylase
MYAMDYPYEFDAEQVRITDELAISGEDKQKLYQLNAERVFHLGASS